MLFSKSKKGISAPEAIKSGTQQVRSKHTYRSPDGKTLITVTTQPLHNYNRAALALSALAVAAGAVWLLTRKQLAARREKATLKHKVSDRAQLLEYKMYCLLAELNRDDPRLELLESKKIVGYLSSLETERDSLTDLQHRLGHCTDSDWPSLQLEAGYSLDQPIPEPVR